MKKIFAILISIFIILCSAACTGCSSAAELFVPLEAEAVGLDHEYYYADDGQLLVTVKRDSVIFTRGEAELAGITQSDLEQFISEHDNIESNEFGDIGLNTLIRLEQESYMQEGAESYTPLIFTRSCQLRRSDDAVISILVSESSHKEFLDLSYGNSGYTVYAVNYDAKTGERLTLKNIALSGIDFTLYARDYIISHSEDSAIKALTDGNAEAWIEKHICCDGMWYFDSDGLTFECLTDAASRAGQNSFSVTIPYTELVKVIKSEYIPETASMGLEPFGEGLFGGDDVASVSGTIVAVDGNKLTLDCNDGSKAVLLLSDNDNKEYARQLIGCEVEIVYYTVTNEVAAITAEE